MSTDVLVLNTLPISETERETRLVIMPFQQEDMESHKHHFFELVYITGGKSMHTLNQTTVMLQEGDFFFMDYKSVHSYTDSKNLTLINCLFLPEIIDDTLKGCESFDTLIQNCLIRYYYPLVHQAPVNRIFHDSENRVLHLLLGMQKEYDEKQAGYGEVFRCRLIEILILSLREVVTEKKALPKSSIVLEAVQYVNTYYNEHITLSMFCEKRHYSLPYISRKFKEETGMNFKSYLQKIRIEKCCELLAGSDMQVHEIAKAVGYHDMKFFHNLFKSYIKVTPKEYRKMTSAYCSAM